jgi:hypothetical protein
VIFCQGKIYLPDDTQPQIFDPVTKTWSNWTRPSTPMCYACFVSWKNYILQFGGPTPIYSRQVQKYDPSTHKWTTLPIYPPFDINRYGCGTFANGDIFIVGPMGHYSYNFAKNVWANSCRSNCPYPNATVQTILHFGYRVLPIPAAAIEVPAKWFSHIPGGCIGIDNKFS